MIKTRGERLKEIRKTLAEWRLRDGGDGPLPREVLIYVADVDFLLKLLDGKKS